MPSVKSLAFCSALLAVITLIDAKSLRGETKSLDNDTQSIPKETKVLRGEARSLQTNYDMPINEIDGHDNAEYNDEEDFVATILDMIVQLPEEPENGDDFLNPEAGFANLEPIGRLDGKIPDPDGEMTFDQYSIHDQHDKGGGEYGGYVSANFVGNMLDKVNSFTDGTPQDGDNQDILDLME